MSAHAGIDMHETQSNDGYNSAATETEDETLTDYGSDSDNSGVMDISDNEEADTESKDHEEVLPKDDEGHLKNNDYLGGNFSQNELAKLEAAANPKNTDIELEELEEVDAVLEPGSDGTGVISQEEVDALIQHKIRIGEWSERDPGSELQVRAYALLRSKKFQEFQHEYSKEDFNEKFQLIQLFYKLIGMIEEKEQEEEGAENSEGEEDDEEEEEEDENQKRKLVTKHVELLPDALKTFSTINEIPFAQECLTAKTTSSKIDELVQRMKMCAPDHSEGSAAQQKEELWAWVQQLPRPPTSDELLRLNALTQEAEKETEKLSLGTLIGDLYDNAQWQLNDLAGWIGSSCEAQQQMTELLKDLWPSLCQLNRSAHNKEVKRQKDDLLNSLADLNNTFILDEACIQQVLNKLQSLKCICKTGHRVLT